MGGIYEDGTYLEANPRWHAEDSPWKADQIVRMIRRNGLRPRTIAEVGCGAGEICRCLHLRLPETTIEGYEISRDAFELCRGKELPGVRFHLGDFLRLEPARRFDLVLTIDVLEHVADYPRFLADLRPRGDWHVLHVPLEMNVQAVARSEPLLNSRRQLGHLHFFSKETALAALRDAGYEIVDHRFTLGSVELPSRTPRMRLVAPLRRVLFALHADLAARLVGGGSLLVLAR